MIPNTTQIPNNLFNGELKKMKGTELKIVLIVARKTLGYIVDYETGMRKKSDWISGGQLAKLSGQSRDAVSRGIKNCVRNGWIEARDRKGNLLDTPKSRKDVGRGAKIFYRLGQVFLKDKEVSYNKILNLRHYKTKLLTKYNKKKNRDLEFWEKKTKEFEKRRKSEN